MKSGICAVFVHACKMAYMRWRTYALLSVTIVLSFSFLLGYLLLMDSRLYNEYKEIFNHRRGDVVIREDRGNMDPNKRTLLLKNLQDMDNTEYFLAYQGSFGHMDVEYDAESVGGEPGTNFYFGNVYALFLPDGVWLDLIEQWTYCSSNDIVWLGERTEEYFSLEADEVILSEKLFFALGMETEKAPVFNLRTVNGLNINLRVVGYAKSSEIIDFSMDSWSITPTMYLSVKMLDRMEKLGIDIWAEKEIAISAMLYFVYTETPEKVISLAKSMEYSSYYSVYEMQDAALEQIRTQKSTKSIIACALLILLGINLYSSFSNALNERKFEIGVKRAIGASAWSIVRQFLYESLMVMLANVAISVVLVVNVAVIYKFIVQWQSQFLETFVLYITPYSMAMFGLCAVTLTVVFSLIFAYKSTQVEIVQYLKAE